MTTTVAPEATMTRAEFYAALDVFVQRLQDDLNSRYDETDILNTTAKANGKAGYHTIGYDDGNRFVKVWDQTGTMPDDTGKSVKYFVEKDTGIIFGAKSWKIFNPNHEYGTLATVDEWNWSSHYATHKEGKPSLVPKALRKK